VFGSGKRTLIEIPGFVQNIDVIWENAEAAAFFERLGSKSWRAKSCSS
jgi:hypothetical protein